MKLKLARAGGGVNVFFEASETHLLVLQPLDFGDQVLEGAAEPVEAPDDKGIPGTSVLDSVFQARPLGRRAAQLVGKDLCAAGFFQRIELEVHLLLAGRDPSVANAFVHGRGHRFNIVWFALVCRPSPLKSGQVLLHLLAKCPQCASDALYAGAHFAVVQVPLVPVMDDMPETAIRVHLPDELPHRKALGASETVE